EIRPVEPTVPRQNCKAHQQGQKQRPPQIASHGAPLDHFASPYLSIFLSRVERSMLRMAAAFDLFQSVCLSVSRMWRFSRSSSVSGLYATTDSVPTGAPMSNSESQMSAASIIEPPP